MRVSMRQAQLAHDQREPDDGERRDCAADVGCSCRHDPECPRWERCERCGEGPQDMERGGKQVCADCAREIDLDGRHADLDSRLGDALRASGINAADALAVQALYATAGQSGSHRIVSALRAVEAWLREGGAL